MEQMRSEFEVWCEKFLGEPPVGGWNSTRYATGYYTHHIHVLWEAWVASRAAIEIEAPAFIDSREALAKGFTVDYSNGFGDGMDAYEANIRAAGLTVKGDR